MKYVAPTFSKPTSGRVTYWNRARPRGTDARQAIHTRHALTFERTRIRVRVRIAMAPKRGAKKAPQRMKTLILRTSFAEVCCIFHCTPSDRMIREHTGNRSGQSRHATSNATCGGQESNVQPKQIAILFLKASCALGYHESFSR